MPRIKQEPEQIIEDIVDFETEIINGNVFQFQVNRKQFECFKEFFSLFDTWCVFQNMPAETNNYTIVLESPHTQSIIKDEPETIIPDHVTKNITSITTTNSSAAAAVAATTNNTTHINGITNTVPNIQTTMYRKPMPFVSPTTITDQSKTIENCKTTSKIYECEMCHLKFKRQYQLKRHKFIGIHEFQKVYRPPPMLQFNDIIEEIVPGADDDNVPIVYQVYYEDNSVDDGSGDGGGGAQQDTSNEISDSGNLSCSTDDADEPESLTCEYCHASFELIDHLDSHMQQHNRKGFFRCELCDAQFNYLEILKNHVTSHVFTKPFKCELCELSFTDVQILRVHLKMHRDKNNFRYKCHQCNEMFLGNEQLTAHLYIHNGVKAFKCEWCSRVFIHNVILKKHISMHHT